MSKRVLLNIAQFEDRKASAAALIALGAMNEAGWDAGLSGLASSKSERRFKLGLFCVSIAGHKHLLGQEIITAQRPPFPLES